MKKCTKCNIEKPLTDFTRSQHAADGRAWKCKSCQAEYMREKKKEKDKFNTYF